MKFISLFAGVGGFDLGMKQAGHECVAQVEHDKHAGGVLKKRFPGIPLYCDVAKVSGEDLPDCDFLTYGFPCQDLSVANSNREGLSGNRSGLFYEASRLIRELIAKGSRIRFALAENVPGLFSADDGLAFARCVRELFKSGACEVGWRVFNSEHFGIPQRRRRVFIVSDLRGQTCDQILSVSESLPGYPAPEQATRDHSSGKASPGVGADVYNGQLTGQTSATVTSATGMPNASGPKVLDLPGKKLELSENIAFNILQDPVSSEDACPTLGAKRGMGVMAIQGSMIGREEKNGPGGSGFKDDGTSFTLTSADKHGVAYEKDKYVVRRLTPKECERLQGFPDDWTSEKSVLVLDGNEWTATGQIRKQSDGQRYKQIGNAVSVPVAKYLGEQMSKAIQE